MGARQNLWYADNKKRNKANTRRWRRNNPEKCKALARKSKYGITEEQYNEMLSAQEGKCAICHRVMIIPFVDHNHNTSKIRELLCRRCNSLLGFAVENIEVLKRAIKYLRKHKD